MSVFDDSAIGPSQSRHPAFTGNLFADYEVGLGLAAGTVSGARVSRNIFASNSSVGLGGGLVDSDIIDNIFDSNTTGMILASLGSPNPAHASMRNAVALNCFYDNVLQGLLLDGNQAPGTISTNVALYNDFLMNGTAMTYAGSEIVDAELNWWGAEDGPSGDGPGSGDPIAGTTLSVVPFTTVPNTWDTPCHRVVDLSVTKVDDVADHILPGETITYTIVVNNPGPWDLSGIRVEDYTPAHLSACTWSCAASPSGSCGSGTGDLVDLADLPAGSAATYSLACTFSPTPTWNVAVNRARVVASLGATDPVSGNNEAVETTISTVIFEDGFESGDTSIWSGTNL
jgi:uncharacterized repeat protein (TIGR01451 family)